ncbi:hypothetical protein L226DRAFT_146509 [Lentinus tigrinus ALCF2SS1-7]|uniref:uncharacterized protein n=1 Tax=Lentinus tigrinus ALCF2SS1-7 TaxID=1328758 RepID=UPI00116621DA|nr:hypothetical protein L226DRAFT_146509 [Lentinus tigrinus ALCF2SS1-7]
MHATSVEAFVRIGIQHRSSFVRHLRNHVCATVPSRTSTTNAAANYIIMTNLLHSKSCPPPLSTRPYLDLRSRTSYTLSRFRRSLRILASGGFHHRPPRAPRLDQYRGVTRRSHKSIPILRSFIRFFLALYFLNPWESAYSSIFAAAAPDVKANKGVAYLCAPGLEDHYSSGTEC